VIRLPRKPLVAALLCLSASPLFAQELDWTALDAETLQHFQAMVRIDTADPPGREIDLTNYITGVLDAARAARPPPPAALAASPQFRSSGCSRPVDTPCEHPEPPFLSRRS